MVVSTPSSLCFLQPSLPASQKLFLPLNILNLRYQKPRGENHTTCHARIRKKVIDDTRMHIVASASTMQKPFFEELDFSSGPTLEVATKIGEAIAKSCLEKEIAKVAFDRVGYPYQGRIQAQADAAREYGLQF